MAPSLGAQGPIYLEKGEWQASVAYRYLHADQGYVGDKSNRRVRDAYKQKIGAKIMEHSFEPQLTYAFSRRYSASLTVPVFYGQLSSKIEHDGMRHTTSAAGVGDVRLVGNMWLLDPPKYSDGNISLGCGFKAPTGDEAATDTFYKKTGRQTRPVDQAIQPGDGGWGIDLELFAFRKIYHRTYGYVSGFYLINPRETNSAYTTTPYPFVPHAAVRKLSVPDQYLARSGLSWAVWPAQQLSLSLGGRMDGIPPRDLVGGSEGFRRPGYVIYAEPGVSWTPGKNIFSLFVPLRLYANREKNIDDDRYGFHGPGAFADFLIIVSYSRRF